MKESKEYDRFTTTHNALIHYSGGVLEVM